MNKQVWFDFHGIYRDAQFWVNGKSVGSHNGAGFTSFKLDVTDFIKSGTNKLIVRGTNEYSPQALPWDRQFDWADDGGIFRPVYLNVCEKNGIRAVHIHQNVMIEQTENFCVHQAPVMIEAEVSMWGNTNKTSELCVQIKEQQIHLYGNMSCMREHPKIKETQFIQEKHHLIQSFPLYSMKQSFGILIIRIYIHFVFIRYVSQMDKKWTVWKVQQDFEA